MTQLALCGKCYQYYTAEYPHVCAGTQYPPAQYYYIDPKLISEKLDKIIELLEKIRIKT